MNQHVVLLGPWGSGSSAYAGAMHHLGAYTCPPHQNTSDPRTPTSYEPLALQAILNKHINELTLLVNGNPLEMGAEIKQWISGTAPADGQVISIKHALLCLIVPTVSAAI